MKVAITPENDYYFIEKKMIMPVVFLDFSPAWCDQAFITKSIIDHNDTVQASVFILCKENQNEKKFEFIIDNSRHLGYPRVDIISLNDNTRLGCFIVRPNEISSFKHVGESNEEFSLPRDLPLINPADMAFIKTGLSSIQTLHNTLRYVKTFKLGIELTIARGGEILGRVGAGDGSVKYSQSRSGERYGKITNYGIDPFFSRKYEIQIYTTTNTNFFDMISLKILGHCNRNYKGEEEEEKKKKAFFARR